MNACFFLGPSLPASQARQLAPTAHLLPPAEQGSVIEAVHHYDAALIGIIDGYFQHRASVWHKEILWALDQGVVVIGGASMGALRAVELEAYGMIGIGEIFAAYRAGALPPFDGLTADDEVAVVHGPGESGYLCATDALVNLRWSYQAALSAGIISRDQHEQLLATAVALPFTRRRHATVLEQQRFDTRALQRWLDTHRVDQKAIDAAAVISSGIRMLDQLCAAPPGADTPPLEPPPFDFNVTEIWRDTLQATVARLNTPAPPTEWQWRIIEAVRDDATLFAALRGRADLHLLIRNSIDVAADRSATTETQTPTHRALRATTNRWREAQGLADREAIDRWLSCNDIALDELEALLRVEARLDTWLDSELNTGLDSTPSAARCRAILDQLKLSGHYPEMAAKAVARPAGIRSDIDDSKSCS